MRVVRNNGHIRKRKRIARLMVLGGILSLGASVAMTFQPGLVLPAYAILIFGFIFFNGGMQQTAKWNRRPRADEVLDQALRRLNDRYTLVHYTAAGQGTPDHILIYPGGLLVITTRDVPGKVIVEDNRWRRVGGRIWMFFGLGGPQLGNPTADSEHGQENLIKFLESEDLPGSDTVDGLIVFMNPRGDVEVISSDLTVVEVDKIWQAVRDLGTEVALTTKERDEIVEALSRGDQVEGPVSLPSRDQRSKGARAA